MTTEALDKATVAQAVSDAGSSFSIGMKALEKPRREAMFALYAFCRAADDAADDSPTVEIAARELAEWRAEIARVFDGAAETAIGRRLGVAVADYGMQRDDFEAVIAGCEMDAGAPVFAPDEATLDLYIDRVACAVGRLSVRAFGVPEPLGAKLAAAQGRALQLTNILRDLDEDAERLRLYVPRELLTKNGIEVETLGEEPWAAISHPGFPAVAAEMSRRARGYFDETFALMAEAPAKAVRPARLMAYVYEAQLKALEARGWAKAAEPVHISKREKIWAALRGYFGR